MSLFRFVDELPQFAQLGVGQLAVLHEVGHERHDAAGRYLATRTSRSPRQICSGLIAAS